MTDLSRHSFLGGAGLTAGGMAAAGWAGADPATTALTDLSDSTTMGLA